MQWLDHLWAFLNHHAWPAIHDFPWVATVQAVAPIWVALVATRALKTWKVQQQAERRAKFLDELIEGVHQYLDTMVKPITIASFVKIGMESHIPPGTTDEVAGSIAFINRAGQSEAKLFEGLRACEPSKQRIESLSVKGQVLGFNNYLRCQHAIVRMTHEIGRLAALAALVASVSLNWENPEVRTHLKRVIAIDIEKMKADLEQQHTEFLAFAKDAYAEIYR